MAVSLQDSGTGVALTDLVPAALDAADALFEAARQTVRAAVTVAGKIDSARVDQEQHAAHGLAWLRVYTESLRQMAGWAERLRADDAFGERERLMLEIAYSEYLARIEGGIPMSQGEIVRPGDLYLGSQPILAFSQDPAVRRMISEGQSPAQRSRLAELMADGDTGHWGLSDDMLEMMREQFERFASERVKPQAHQWHLRDELVPLEIIEELSELGVFGLNLPEDHGGLGLSKEAMCVVTEELSRGYIGVGSLPTRSEIAGELIRLGGTDEQKARFLPKIASGEIIPTAVFTEPNIGSDLANLTTRAELVDGKWRITGAKNWITHAARADLMTVLVRTKPDVAGYRGLSMMLVEKPRGTDDDDFPLAGLSGGEIEGPRLSWHEGIYAFVRWPRSARRQPPGRCRG